MACSSIIESSNSSSSSLTQRRNYDVFISFRGKDTRYNFTDHLFGALKMNSIHAFRDDKNLKIGESIAPELLRAIEGSEIYIVIFSKNYATSKWCLQELEKIVDCVRVSGKRLLPIYYYVDASDVRYQKGSFCEAFEKHEERYEEEIVQRWREALSYVANISGPHIHDMSEYAEIQKIVQEIKNILGYKFSSFLPNDLVGTHTPIEELEKLLQLDSLDDVRVLGISGMGGIGKTTLATILYGRISNQFNACCFIDDLSRVYKQDGPIGAQKQILYQTQGGEHLQVWNVYDGTNLIRRKLCRVRALIILDNIDHVEQLEKIGINHEWLHAGSRMILISRDAHILKDYGVDEVFNVPILKQSHAYQLFYQKAFKRDNIMTINEKLVSEILHYAGGLPLAIKVLGSFLYGRNISEWISALARLRECPHKDIMDVLRLSFDGLEKNEKDIFLHIACFFNNHFEDYVRNILNCCGFHTDIGLRVLIDKSLITISSIIHMHPTLSELGRNIVHEYSIKEPRKWSRLWLDEHLYNVMSENMEDSVEAIVLRQSEGKGFIAESLTKMSRLRFLILKRVEFPESFTCNSGQLRYIEWDYYPYMHLPSSFHPNQLVELLLCSSSIKILWKDKKYLPNLKTLDLSWSKNLIKMPNFGEIPNLEKLHLEGCVQLVHIDVSIGLLRKLVVLNLRQCENLISILNEIFSLNSLEDIHLSSHSKLPSFSYFSCLRQLDISFCGVTKIPDFIGCLCCLEILDLTGNNFVTMPSLKKLSKLVYLDAQHCKQLKSLPELPLPATIKQYHHIFSGELLPKTSGLCFFNCPKLCQSKQSHKMILSWMTQFLLANHEPCEFFSQLDILIPGSEIPRWFNNRSSGNSILHVDLSPIMQHNNRNNFIGVACYVVFSLGSHCTPWDTTTMWWPKIGFFFLRKSLYTCRADINHDLIKVKSNHMWLCYFPLDTLDLTNENSDAIMKTHIDSNGNGLHVEVESFGYHWVSKRDLQVLMHSGDLLDHKNKFLEIE